MEIYKDNVVMTINENEFAYYQKQGFKKHGEREMVNNTISLSNHQTLMAEKDKEISELKKELKKANKKPKENVEENNG